jgi:hypothetical protein
MKPTAESISMLIKGLSSAPDYISKLEQMRAENSEAKEKKIVQLEAEIQM